MLCEVHTILTTGQWAAAADGLGVCPYTTKSRVLGQAGLPVGPALIQGSW